MKKYGLFNNLRWYLTYLRKDEPSLAWTATGLAIDKAAAALLGVFTPALLVGAIVQHATLGEFAWLAVLTGLGLAITSEVEYLLMTFDIKGTSLRTQIEMDFHQQQWDLDYDQISSGKIQDLAHTAFSKGLSWTYAGAEAIYIYGRGTLIDIATLLVFLATLSTVIPWVFALVLLSAAISYAGLSWYRKWYQTNNVNWNKLSRQQAYISRNAYALENGKDIRMFGMAGWYHTHLDRLLSLQDAWQRRNSLRHFLGTQVGELAGLCRDALVYGSLVIAVTQRSLSIAQFTLMFGMTNGFITLLDQLLKDFSGLQTASLDLQELREFMTLKPRTPARPLTTSEQAQLAQRPVTIHFDHVTFRYPEAKTASLKDVSFTLEAGQKLAIVGVNGAGKSTLARLMMGLLHPTSGTILINGLNADLLPLATRFSLFAPVFQETIVLALSLADNVALTNPPQPQRVESALKDAGLADFVVTLPQKAHTPMTRYTRDDGIELSGGQSQKLMLARALYKDAPVLVLDEPTAALDAIAENEVYQEYAQLASGKTSLFISHRLASTRFCDAILFMDHGQVLESGTHDQLIANNGRYAQMYHIQSKYYQPEAKEVPANDNL
ncbi:ABC transporter ATP-binding protein [Lacticaseibacillus paracasei]|uniref:ABC transporter n=1 Tax=Lacticaseibacillus paracasei NRIC 0644 TaxID=1435038 RepID=A0A0C9NZ94_LACPA|nr:ABC transporter ATP-binding protein [Lacticaseibacillus paracasei]MXI82696.1 ATP-binding cassette domain-containing protein [Lacticaseibacillus paracasei]QXJ66859.1 ABC transporter ATP-binding protein/permease [Lacticaseibacillus paracasei subsp. paracasei]GAN37375.1 ABC transporter [Lacticaseibacillus paracasei NRIC 0644]GAN40168.1 ABC transporter [Lacticaseibacillus paracasei NRIC 1917]